MACGSGHTVAVKTDGTLYTWGDNSRSQLGAVSLNSEVPGQVGADTTWSYVVAGKYHSLAVTTDYKLYAWGANESGQLGNGLTADLAAPAQIVSALSFVLPAAGDQSSAALDYTTGVVKTFGRNIDGQLGDGTVQQLLAPDSRISSTWKKFASGGSHVLAIDNAGKLWSWGSNTSGQLGDGTNISHSAPAQVGVDTTWTDVFASVSNSAAIKADGSLWVWGGNASGQVGNGGTTTQLTPYQIDSSDVTSWKTAALGDAYALAVSSTGKLYAWGDNNYGQLGQTKSTAAVKVPSQIDDSGDWVAVYAGSTHSLGLRGTTVGAYNLYAWGQNIYGQLGTGNSTSLETPTKVGSQTWKALSAGFNHSAGIDNSGNLYTWGFNATGQLGQGAGSPANTPTKVGTSTWIQISAGNAFTAGIMNGGSLWAWGQNDLGQNGDGSTINRTSPVRVGTLTTWSLVSAGKTFVIAGTGASSPYTLSGWGDNSSGALGEGSAQISPRSVTAGATGSGTLTVLLVGGTASAVSGGTLDYATGDRLLFTGTFAGTGPFAYQWKRNGTSIGSATGPSYEIAAATATDAGTYTVSLKNAYGTQSAATLVLSNYTAPSVSTLSPKLNLVTGGSLSLTTTVTGSNLTYQWKKDGTAIGGATLSSYILPGLAPINSGSYSLDVSNSKNGTVAIVNSGSSLVTVLDPIVIGGTQQATYPILLGGNVTLGSDLTVTGGGTIKYQWRRNLLTVQNNTTPTYAITGATTSDAGTYDVVVYNDASSATSSKTIVQLKSAPVVTLSPSTQTVQNGRSVSLTAQVTGFPTPAVLWYGPGIASSGTVSTSSSGSNFTRTIPNFGTANVGSYYVVATNDAGATTSSLSVLQISNSSVIAPVITAQPVNSSFKTPGSITLSVTATGTAPTYQWRLGGLPVSAATSSTLTLSNLAVGSYIYDVVVSNSAGQVTSNAVTVLVTTTDPPTITTQPKSKLVLAKSILRLSVVATDTTSYQWFKGGSPIAGATLTTYTVPSATSSDSGSYYVVVSSSAGSVQSATAVVTVGDPFSTLSGSFSARMPAEPALVSSPGAKEGIVNISVTRSGTASGVYQAGLNRYSFAGRFDANGVLTTSLRPAANDDWLVISVTGTAENPGISAKVRKGNNYGTARTLVRLGVSNSSLTGTYTGAFGDGTTTALSGYITVNVVALGSRVLVAYGLPTGETASGSTSLYADPLGQFTGLFTDLVVPLSNTKRLYSTIKVAPTFLAGDAVVYSEALVKAYDVVGANYAPPSDGSPIAPFVSSYEEGVINVDGIEVARITSLGRKLSTLSVAYSASGGRLSLSLNSRTGLVSGVVNTSASVRKTFNFVILQGQFRFTNAALGAGVTRDGLPVVLKPGL